MTTPKADNLPKAHHEAAKAKTARREKARKEKAKLAELLGSALP